MERLRKLSLGETHVPPTPWRGHRSEDELVIQNETQQTVAADVILTISSLPGGDRRLDPHGGLTALWQPKGSETSRRISVVAAK